MLRDYFQLPRFVHILCLGSLLNRAGSFVVVFLTIYASENLGFGVPFATACMGVFGIGSMVGSILGGQLADQIGRRIVMLMSLFGGAAMLLLLGTLENRWAFMAAVGIFATVVDMYRPAAGAMIADVVSIDRRPHAFALMYISINLGFAIAPIVGGWLAEISYSLLFLGDAITMSLYGVIITMFIGETLPANTSKTPGHTKQGIQSDQIPVLLAIKRMVSDTPFVVFCAANFLMMLVFMQCISTVPIYLRQCGFSNAQYGMLMSINGVMIVVMQLPATQWLSRYRVMSVVTVGGVLIAFGFGSLGLGSSALFFATMVAIWTCGEIMQFPFKNAIVTDIAPVEIRARYLGLFGMMFGLAVTIGSPLGGQILTRFGAETLWIGTFAVSAAAVTLFLLVHGPITKRISAAQSAGNEEPEEIHEEQSPRVLVS